MRTDLKWLRRPWKEHRHPSRLQIACTSKTNSTSKWDLRWRPGYGIVHIECNGHFLHNENQATGKVHSCSVKDIILEPPMEFWNIDTQFSTAGRYINHPADVPTITLND